MGRKTVEVKTMLEYANEQLARTDEWADKRFKEGTCAMIEKILHISNNYNGFMFIDSNDMKVNTLGYYSRKYFKY